MPAHSIYLSKLASEEREDLKRKLCDRQGHLCFLCEGSIDLDLHGDDLHIDHIIPIVNRGPDDPINFALLHAVCNEKEGCDKSRDSTPSKPI